MLNQGPSDAKSSDLTPDQWAPSQALQDLDSAQTGRITHAVCEFTLRVSPEGSAGLQVFHSFLCPLRIPQAQEKGHWAWHRRSDG